MTATHLELEPVHWSHIKQIGTSPKHYLAAVQSRPDTAAMRVGRATHAWTLQDIEPIVYTGKVRRGGAWEDFQAKHPGAEDILSQGEAIAVTGMVNALRDHPTAMCLLRKEATTVEVDAKWAYLDRACAGRLDAVGANYICDLKTTNRIHPRLFLRHALNLGYHGQLAWYQHGARQAGLSEARDLYLVCVESQAPWDVVCWELDRTAIDAGRKLMRGYMEQLQVCEATGHWPGIAEDILTFRLPD